MSDNLTEKAGKKVLSIYLERNVLKKIGEIQVKRLSIDGQIITKSKIVKELLELGMAVLEEKERNCIVDVNTPEVLPLH